MKKFLAAVAMVATVGLAVTNVEANNVTFTSNAPIPGSVNFSAIHTDNLAFTDTFKWTNPGQFLGDAFVINIKAPGLDGTKTDIDFTSVTLNGNPLAITNLGAFSQAITPSSFSLTAPLVLVVKGTSGAVAPTQATYSGVLSISQVPEPASLLLLGSGLVGLAIWRRKFANS